MREIEGRQGAEVIGARRGVARSRMALAVLSAVAAAVLTGPTAGSAATGTIAAKSPKLTFTEYHPPTNPAGANALATGSDGNIWATEFLSGAIARITPHGVVTEFPVPHTGCLVDITAGPDGNLWFTDLCNSFVGRITTHGVISEFPVPPDKVLDPWMDQGLGQSPSGITPGPDGNLWIAEFATDRVLQIHPDGSYGKDFMLPRHPGLPRGNPDVSGPDGIALGADNNLWFTESRFGGGRLVGNRVARMTLDGHFTEFEIPTLDSRPRAIAEGPDHHLWFTEEAGNNIGRISTSGHITEFAVPTPSSIPDGITEGPDHAMWFTEAAGSAPGLGRIAVGGKITEWSPPTRPSFPQATGAVGITTGPDDNVWFTEIEPNTVVRANLPRCDSGGGGDAPAGVRATARTVSDDCGEGD